MMSKVTLCCSCNEQICGAHICTVTESVATGTITYEDRFFGLVKKVTRNHKVPPPGSRGRQQNTWYEYHGAKKTWLLQLAMRWCGRDNMVLSDSRKWVFRDEKFGLIGLPEDWQSV